MSFDSWALSRLQLDVAERRVPPDCESRPFLRVLMRRNFDRFSRIIVFDLVNNLIDVIGISVSDVIAYDGCTVAEIFLQEKHDFRGIDLRSRFIYNQNVISIFKKYQVFEVSFHKFRESSGTIERGGSPYGRAQGAMHYAGGPRVSVGRGSDARQKREIDERGRVVGDRVKQILITADGHVNFI